MQRPHWILLGLVAVLAVGLPLLWTSSPEDADQEEEFLPEGTAGLAGRGDGPRRELPPELKGLGIPDDLDLDDSDAVLQLILKTLKVTPVSWERIARLIGRLPSPIEDPLRSRLLEEVRLGTPQMRRVFEFVQDGSLLADLLKMLKARDFAPDGRDVLLQAIAMLPSDDTTEVVEALQVYLTGNTYQDQDVLRAIVRRGGPASADALLHYTLRHPDPRVLRGLLQEALVSADETVKASVREELARPHDPKVLVVLIDAIGQAGEEALVAPLRALDHEERHERVRRAAYGALGRIGTESAVEHLVRAGGVQDDRGGDARRALERMSDASDDARDHLVEAYDTVEDTGRRIAILRALSNMQHEPATKLLARALDSEEASLRVTAVYGLAKAGERARPHVGKLVQLWSGADKGARVAIVSALAAAGGTEAREALQTLQKDATVDKGLQALLTQALRKLETPEN